MKLKAGIIGIGNIGAFIDTPLSANIASHTKAYLSCKKTELVTIFEPNSVNVEKFKKIWKKDVRVAKDLEEFFNYDLDVVSIASPTLFHFEQLKYALKSKVRYILCEKPLVNDIQEMEKIETELLNSKKKILINLIREYSPAFLELKQKIESEEFGKIISFEGFCTKGLFHNGIHLITLIGSIISRAIKIEPLLCVYDKKNRDVNGDFIVYTKTVTGHLKSIKELDYSEFYLTIWLEKGKIEIKTDEIIYYNKEVSSGFIGYNQLEQNEIKKNILKNYQLDVIKYLLTHEDTKSILKEHIKNHKVIFKTIQKVRDETGN